MSLCDSIVIFRDLTSTLPPADHRVPRVGAYRASLNWLNKATMRSFWEDIDKANAQAPGKAPFAVNKYYITLYYIMKLIFSLLSVFRKTDLWYFTCALHNNLSAN
jgi:hypothetical protein